MADQSVPNAMEHSGVTFPPPLIYVGFFLVGWLLQQRFPVFALPAPVRSVSGILCVGVGLGLAIWSVMLFRQAQTSLVPNKPSAALVVVGPYHVTRNPMYLGLLLLYVGVALLAQVIWALILVPVLIGIIQWQVIAREERYLEGKFGAEYSGYRRRVRRWL